MSSPSNPIRAFLLGIILQCYAPRLAGTTWEWAEKHVELTPGQSPGRPGQYDSSYTPLTRTIQDFPFDPDWDELFVKKSSQAACTEAALNAIRRCVNERPTNILYSIDSRDEAKKILRVRLNPNGQLRDFIPANLGGMVEDDDIQMLTVYLPHMTLYLAGGHAGGALANKPVGFAIIDEMDEHPSPKPGDMENTDKLRERLKTVPNKKLLGLGRPTTDKGLTEREYLTGTQEKAFGPCPHCGYRQELIFEQLRFDHCKDLVGEWDLQRVVSETYYECVSCQGKLVDAEHKYQFALEAAKDWRITNPKHMPRKRSIHISDLYSPFVTWGQLAVEFLQAVHSGSPVKLQGFYNSRLGLAFKQQRAEITETDVLACRGAYKRGVCPFPFADVCLITQTTDKQGDVFKSTKAAFKKNGEMAVIDYAITLTEQDLLDWAADPVTVFAGETHPEGMAVKLALIDEGFQTTAVRDFVQASGGIYYASKGRGGIQVKSVVNMSKTNHKGEEMIVYHYDDDDFKKQLYVARIAKLKDIQSGKARTPRLWLPMDIDPEFAAELMAERLEEEKQKWGFPKWVWEKVGEHNDFGDALKMQLVIWHVVGHYFREEELPEAPPGKPEIVLTFDQELDAEYMKRFGHKRPAGMAREDWPDREKF